MASWIVWSVSVFVALLLGFVSSHFNIRTLRWVGFITLLILVLAITRNGTSMKAAPSDIGGSFADGAKNLSSAFFRPVWSLFHGSGEPAPVRYGWIVIAVVLALGYRQLEAFAMRRQPPVLDVSKVSTKQRNNREAGDQQWHRRGAPRLDRGRTQVPDCLRKASREYCGCPARAASASVAAAVS